MIESMRLFGAKRDINQERALFAQHGVIRPSAHARLSPSFSWQVCVTREHTVSVRVWFVRGIGRTHRLVLDDAHWLHFHDVPHKPLSYTYCSGTIMTIKRHWSRWRAPRNNSRRQRVSVYKHCKVTSGLLLLLFLSSRAAPARFVRCAESALRHTRVSANVATTLGGSPNLPAHTNKNSQTQLRYQKHDDIKKSMRLKTTKIQNVTKSRSETNNSWKIKIITKIKCASKRIFDGFFETSRKFAAIEKNKWKF